MLDLVRKNQSEHLGDIYVFIYGDFVLRLNINSISDRITIMHKNEEPLTRNYPSAIISDNGVSLDKNCRMASSGDIDSYIEMLKEYKEAIAHGEEIFKNRQEIIKKYENI